MELPLTLSRKLKDYTMSLKLSQDNLAIQLRNNSSTYMLSSVLENNKLPSSFTNIFDNIQEIYEYVKNDKNNMIGVIDNSQILQIGVPSPIVKTKMLKIPLAQVPISKEELIQMELKKQKGEIKKLEEKVGKLEKVILDIVPVQIQRLLNKHLDSFRKKIQTQLEKCKDTNRLPVQSSAAATASRFPYDPFTTSNIFNQKPQSQPLTKSSVFTFKPQAQSKIFSPIQWKDTFKQKSKENNSSNSNSLDIAFKNPSSSINEQPKQTTQSKQIVAKAKCFDFDIDQTNKYLSYYIVKGKKITKKYDNGDELYQLYSSNHIPEEGRYQIIFQIDQITDNMIWVGFITEDKKIQRFIGDQVQTISLGCNGGNELSIDGSKSGIQIQQIRKGQLITMQIEIKAKKVKFFKNSNSTPFVAFALPESMLGKRIYPFLQMVAKNDSVTLIS